MEKLNVVVLCGGDSVESDISLITGVQVYNSLDVNLYNKHLVYIDKSNLWWECLGVKNAKDIFFCKKKQVCVNVGKSELFLIKKRKYKQLFKIHCVVLALHGSFGENGTIQGLLEMCNIPYTSSSNISSGLTMDKCVTKLILKGSRMATLPFKILKKYQYYQNGLVDCEKIAKIIKFPCIIKPSCLGSSIGIKIANNINELKSSIEFAFKFDNKIIIEKALENFTEYNISARLDNGEILLSEIESPIRSGDILSFKDKYITNGKTKIQKVSQSKGMAGVGHKIPANITKCLETKIKNATVKVYELLDCAGVVRCDYLLSKDNKLYLNEVNSIPGSFSYYLWSKKSFSDLLNDEINNAIKRFLRDKNLIKNFETSIFQ